MDAIFGRLNLRSEIHWHYYNKMHDYRKKLYAAATDTILFYIKDTNSDYFFKHIKEKRDKPTQQLIRKKVDGKMVNASDTVGNLMYQSKTVKGIDNVRRIPYIVPESSEYTGFKTQKPRMLLLRIIESSSNLDDVIFDRFCGCATTLVAVDELRRQWVGIDISSKAIELLVDRIKQD